MAQDACRVALWAVCHKCRASETCPSAVPLLLSEGGPSWRALVYTIAVPANERVVHTGGKYLNAARCACVACNVEPGSDMGSVDAQQSRHDQMCTMYTLQRLSDAFFFAGLCLLPVDD